MGWSYTMQLKRNNTRSASNTTRRSPGHSNTTLQQPTQTIHHTAQLRPTICAYKKLLRGSICARHELCTNNSTTIWQNQVQITLIRIITTQMNRISQISSDRTEMLIIPCVRMKWIPKHKLLELYWKKTTTAI